MKKLISVIALAFSGCAYQHTADIDPSRHTAKTFTQIVWLQKGSQEGLKVHSTSKNGTSAAFSVSKEGTETQTEALKAIAEGVAKGVLEGAKTP
jgi:hypothetical protein